MQTLPRQEDKQHSWVWEVIQCHLPSHCNGVRVTMSTALSPPFVTCLRTGLSPRNLLGKAAWVAQGFQSSYQPLQSLTVLPSLTWCLVSHRGHVFPFQFGHKIHIPALPAKPETPRPSKNRICSCF